MTSDALVARQVETNEKEIDAIWEKLNSLGSVDMDASTTINNNPSYYTSVVTYEIKESSAIGLNEQVSAFADIQYVYVHTFSSTNEELNVQSYQQAFGIDAEGAIVTAFRVASTEEDSWNEWSSGLASNAGGTGGDTPVLPDPPEDQPVGSFWLEPIDAVNE